MEYSYNTKKILDLISSKSPLQKKKIDKYLSKKDMNFLNEFETFLENYISYLNKNSISIEYCVDAYLKMCNDMLKSQIKFMRSGKYPVSRLEDAQSDVYNNKSEMLSYMIGLAISQYLWSTHYEMFTHLNDELNKSKDSIKNYMEIGPGHGLFLKNALDILGDDIEMSAIDISHISLDVTKSIINYFYPHKYIKFINDDMLNVNLDSKCDFIVMGEVIEHVQEPRVLLKKIYKLLKKDGKAFLSTCVNCPAIDHIYHFHTVEEIREMFNECGLKIESEKILPVEDLAMEDIIKQKITINYSAVVTKAFYE